MNDFVGVYGERDPAGALRALGVEPAWHDAEVAFGGAPVWTSAAGDVVLAGELVLDNARELRALLELPETDAGTLIAELLRCHGAAGIRPALGMFALAVWDTRRRRLTLLRDAPGARTLYYARQGRACWFAARLRSLRRTPAVSDALSLAALRDYLICAFVPGEATLWRDARELRPGTALTLPDGTSRCFWEPAEGALDLGEPIDACAARLRALLEEAVRVRLPASGPVAVTLSGGLDSSLVTALVAQQAPGPVHTFAIHFGPEYPNELPFSGRVAAHCGTRHHVIELPARQIRGTLVETMAALDDPIGDPLTTPNLLLGRAAAEHAKILLNGEGGDPCFGGPKNVPMLLHELYGAGDASREEAYLRSFQKCYDDLPRLLTPAVKEGLRDAPPPETLVGGLSDSPMRHYLNRLMDLNVRMKGADQILTKVNNLTTACGLLGRSPLFDRRVVAASFATPPAYKREGATEKAVLKRAVADLLPAAILERPKSGMLVPVQRWFQRGRTRGSPLRDLARDFLLGRRARIRPYLRHEPLQEWLDSRGSLWPRHGVKLWLVLALEAWLRAQE
jgi:asparagine synthase (glutamine-hydrolysing)